MDHDRLQKLILKYSDALRTHHYPRVTEREGDRLSLAGTTDHLDSPRNWGMDSHLYFLLARTHDEAAKQLLLQETNPRQRIGMLWIIARRCFHPLVGIPGRVTFRVPMTLRPEGGAGDEEEPDLTDRIACEADATVRPYEQTTPVHRHRVPPESLLERERRVAGELKTGLDMTQMQAMDIEEIQMVSHHLGASSRLSPRIDGDRIHLAAAPAKQATDDNASPTRRHCVVLANRTMESTDDGD